MSVPILSLFIAAILSELLFIYIFRKQRNELLRLTQRQKYERITALDLLQRLSRSFEGEIDANRSLRAITEYLTELTGAEAGASYLLDRAAGQLAVRASSGLFPPLNPAVAGAPVKKQTLVRELFADRIPLGAGIIGETALSGIALRLDDGPADARIVPQTHERVPLRNALCVPLRAHDRVLGVFCAINKRGGAAFAADELERLLAVAPLAATLIETVQLYGEVARQAQREQELQLAHHFQQMLLPKELPVAPGIEFAGANVSAREAGGDFYDFIWIDANRLALVIADIVGKGIPGTLIMSTARSVIRAQSPYVKSPLDMMLEVNRRFVLDTEDKVFLTMIYAIIDFRTATLSFCRAGQDPLITCGADAALHFHSPEGIALGLIEQDLEKYFEVREIPLRDGDIFLLHTDGLIRTMNEKDEEYGRERLTDLLQSHRHLPVAELQARLLRELQSFTGQARRHDDITLILFRVLDAELFKERSRARNAEPRPLPA